MEVSWNGGIPKPSMFIGFVTINHPFWGHFNRIFHHNPSSYWCSPIDGNRWCHWIYTVGPTSPPEPVAVSTIWGDRIMFLCRAASQCLRSHNINVLNLHKLQKCSNHKLHNVKKKTTYSYILCKSVQKLGSTPCPKCQASRDMIFHLWICGSGMSNSGWFDCNYVHIHTHVYMYIYIYKYACVCFCYLSLFIMNSHIVVWYYPIISDSDGINGIYWEIKNIMYDSWKLSMMTSSHNNCRL